MGTGQGPVVGGTERSQTHHSTHCRMLPDRKELWRACIPEVQFKAMPQSEAARIRNSARCLGKECFPFSLIVSGPRRKFEDSWWDRDTKLNKRPPDEAESHVTWKLAGRLPKRLALGSPIICWPVRPHSNPWKELFSHHLLFNQWRKWLMGKFTE